MIKVNGLEIAQNHFPDNSLLIKLDKIPKSNTLAEIRANMYPEGF